MMNFSLIIPAFEDGHFLQVRIAGLTLLKRLAQTARRAGIQRVIVLGPKMDLPPEDGESVEFVSRFQDLRKSPLGICILLKSGYLPEVAFLKSLLQWPPRPSAFFFHHLPALLVLEGANVSRLEKLWERKGFDRLFDDLKQGSFSEFLTPDSARIYEVRDSRKIAGVEDQLFKGLIKDTEGLMSKYLERKISIAITRRLVQTSVTPNQMTLVSILVGLAGAFFMGINRGSWQVAGSCLFLLHSILDGCDGEIARLKFAESRWGGLLDFWGDNVVHSAVFIAIAWEWWARTQFLFPIVLAAFAVSAAWGSAGLIYWKTMRNKGKEGPLYTSISPSPVKNKIVRIADFLSRRDFIYLAVILAFFGHLDWFLYAGAVGTPVFAAVLLGLMTWEGIKFGWGMKAEGESGGKGE